MTDKLTPFEFVQKWFSDQCDGNWELDYGLSIDTDFSRWSVKIDLRGTPLENRKLDLIEVERSDDDWIHIHDQIVISSLDEDDAPYDEVIEKVFFGVGGTGNLEEILKNFQEFATKE